MSAHKIGTKGKQRQTLWVYSCNTHRVKLEFSVFFSFFLARQLSYVRQCCEGKPEGDGVSALTSDERTRWAKVWVLLLFCRSVCKTKKAEEAFQYHILMFASIVYSKWKSHITQSYFSISFLFPVSVNLGYRPGSI